MAGKSSVSPTAPDKLLDLKIAQLSMLQNAIGRMAGYSANAKNYCTTVLAAVVALSAQSGSARLVYGAFVATMFFGVLDFYYLILEVRFRESYTSATAQLYDSDISITPVKASRTHFFKAACSASILLFYGPIFAACVAAYLLSGA